MEIQWRQEVEKRKQMLVEDLQKFLQIKSVLDDETKGENAPFGKGIQEALEYMLYKGEEDGFTVKNVDGYAGHIEMGHGEDIVGVLCHVDVVPEGDGWTSDPYGAEIRDGNIYARGAIDDKGPTLAAYYGMKIVQELSLPLRKRVRLILGADEESGWNCVEHYFKKEEMPTIGFAPDADFPIIYAEKGILDVHLTQKKQEDITTAPILIQFDAGRRLNMVPDLAKAVLTAEKQEIVAQYNDYLISEQLTGKCWIEKGQIHIELNGQSAHGSEPQLGKNAGLLLAKFLHQLQLDQQGESFIQCASQLLASETGADLGIQYHDETGDLTVNVGVMHYTAEEGGKCGLNIRYPVTANKEQIVQTIKAACETNGFSIGDVKNSSPHHVDKNHPLITTLQKVYEEQTGEKAELLSIGGGTYARALQAGVAFGALFQGNPDVAHQKDEYINIDDLLRATSIYAQAVYELAK